MHLAPTEVIKCLEVPPTLNWQFTRHMRMSPLNRMCIWHLAMAKVITNLAVLHAKTALGPKCHKWSLLKWSSWHSLEWTKWALLTVHPVTLSNDHTDSRVHLYINPVTTQVITWTLLHVYTWTLSEVIKWTLTSKWTKWSLDHFPSDQMDTLSQVN